MAGSLENRGKLRELIDKFQFVCVKQSQQLVDIFLQTNKKNGVDRTFQRLLRQ